MSDSLKEEVEDLKEICETYKIILKGNPKSDKPNGLIYSVHENTKFRQQFSRINLFILLTVLGLAVKAVLDLLGIL